jgi:hypothetical protein
MATIKNDVARADFEVRTGDDYRIRVTYYEQVQDEEPLPVDLRHIKLNGKARTAYNVDADAFPLPITISDQDKEKGVFYIVLSKNLTTQFRPDQRPKKFMFDVESVDADGWTTTFLEGSIVFIQDVTN